MTVVDQPCQVGVHAFGPTHSFLSDMWHSIHEPIKPVWGGWWWRLDNVNRTSHFVYLVVQLIAGTSQWMFIQIHLPVSEYNTKICIPHACSHVSTICLTPVYGPLFHFFSNPGPVIGQSPWDTFASIQSRWLDVLLAALPFEKIFPLNCLLSHPYMWGKFSHYPFFTFTHVLS